MRVVVQWLIHWHVCKTGSSLELRDGVLEVLAVTVRTLPSAAAVRA